MVRIALLVRVRVKKWEKVCESKRDTKLRIKAWRVIGHWKGKMRRMQERPFVEEQNTKVIRTTLIRF